VEKDGHAISANILERNLGAGGLEKHTGAESEKESSWDGNLGGSYVRDHLVYTHKIFSKVEKVVKSRSPEKFLMKMVIVNHSSETSPNVADSFFIPLCLFLIFESHTFFQRIMMHMTKCNKITKLSRVFDFGII
jgi:hypothetical protein